MLMKLTQEKNENYLRYMNNGRFLPHSHTNLKGECIIVPPISQTSGNIISPICSIFFLKNLVNKLSKVKRNAKKATRLSLKRFYITLFRPAFFSLFFSLRIIRPPKIIQNNVLIISNI